MGRAVEAGEAVALQPLVVTGERAKAPSESQIEAAKTAEPERYRHEQPGDSKTVHFDVLHIVAGVVRAENSADESEIDNENNNASAENSVEPERPAPRKGIRAGADRALV